jgi:hypothetical protein
VNTAHQTLRIVFIGESWRGSSARSLREALTTHQGVVICEIDEDHFLPKHASLPLRAANRVLASLHRRELESSILAAAAEFRPDVVVIYKGASIGAPLVEELRRNGCAVVNVFPDCAPNLHGRRLREAVGQSDLVISTKPFHPEAWHRNYGYRNRCVHVPHGYDPDVHLWMDPAPAHEYDVVMCATWRAEYHRLMLAFATAVDAAGVSVAIAGSGWAERRGEFPASWQLFGPRMGRSYGEFVRSARIVIAPITREVVVRGIRQPGDEDTTRTYELAAAHCFFLHQRSNYVTTVYDPVTEVPLWSDSSELAREVLRWLPDEAGRRACASRAHARAVPHYSIPNRAGAVLQHIRDLVGSKQLLGSGR